MITQLARSTLQDVRMYIGLQKVIGADRLRYRCIEMLGPTPEDTVLDVGCGPAYYLDAMPELEYYGFDTNEPYIDFARSRFGDRATFHVGIFDSESARELPEVDKVMLIKLLHHLDDDEIDALFETVRSVLEPGGRVVTLDTCFHDSQNSFRRWMARNDRGEYVRYSEAFDELAGPHFGRIEGTLITDVCRIPSTYYVMTLEEPVPAPESKRSDS